MSGKPYRLPLQNGIGRRVDQTKPVSFSFDGKQMQGLAGDTLASALLANGQRIMARSFKYHRPRSLISLGSEEPNAIVGIGEGAAHEPNIRAGQVELFEGLVAKSQNRWPSLDFDIGILNDMFSRFMPSGFYYKTFMWPASFWYKVYEPVIRYAAGLGVAPDNRDQDIYEQIHVDCDVLVAGAGVAGIAAAEAAAISGQRVIICDENPYFGGQADISTGMIEDKPQIDWVREKTAFLADHENVQVLNRTTVTGAYAHNYLLALQQVSDHDPEMIANGAPRHRLWKIRAAKVIMATGAIERSLTFANNDRPGIMLSGAARGLVERYGVAPGLTGSIFTTNDDGYRTALSLKQAGVGVARIIDCRQQTESEAVNAAIAAGIEVQFEAAISNVETSRGGKSIEAVKVAPYQKNRGRVTDETRIACDFVAVAGGFNPVVNLWCHNGGKLKFDSGLSSFVPDSHHDNIVAVGSANGAMDLATCIDQGYAAGETSKFKRPKTSTVKEAKAESLWFSPASGSDNEGIHHFIDFQHDVKASDLELAQREGYESVEHTKRYTTLGMATDQGKNSNINAMAVIALATGKKLEQVGTTTFRPPYTPISFGAIAGTSAGKLFHPVRETSVYGWHLKNTNVFEPVGDWRRPYCYPKPGESKQDAINREILNVRENVGILDASTLGKIEIKGPDAAKLLDLVYSNMFSTLKVGHCRYGLMLNELGFISDDGVTARLAEDHFLIHTTSGASDRIAAWLEEWLQTEWFDLDVFVTPVTEQWAQFAIAGPNARKVLEHMGTDIDLSLPFMTMASGNIGGFPVRLFRISFSGELSYELATPAGYGQSLWDAIMTAGSKFDIGVYGTEALHVLRAEKGFIVVGDETDGTVTPHDVGMSWAVSRKKPDFIGKRSLQQPFLAAEGRKQLVGLYTIDPDEVLPDGAHAVREVKQSPPMQTIGHVTSSYWSPTLKRSIAMALIENGRARMGETISFQLEDRTVKAEIVDPVFYDKQGDRQNV